MPRLGVSVIRGYLVGVALLSMFLPPAFSLARKPLPPQPTEFTIGRRTFFDFGPPFEYFEIVSVRPAAGGATIERVQLNASQKYCTPSADVRVATASIEETVSALLGKVNPCSIPEKELRRELKRCKKCLVFSGADVVMQVKCGNQTRRFRIDILDRDLYDARPLTPQHTSWTMNLLGRLDRALGSNVMERPSFTPDGEPQPESQSSALLDDVERGEFDGLFPAGSDKPSVLVRQAHNQPPKPRVELVRTSPIQPISFTLPEYPQLARMANIEGQVSFTVLVTADGHASDLKFVDGHPLLRSSIAAPVNSWVFPPEAANQRVQATIEFKTNCFPSGR